MRTYVHKCQNDLNFCQERAQCHENDRALYYYINKEAQCRTLDLMH